jgi:hypothetical protein
VCAAGDLGPATDRAQCKSYFTREGMGRAPATGSSDDDQVGKVARRPTMKPRFHVFGYARTDLDRALAFYRDGLGSRTKGLIGAEFKGRREHAR